MNYDESLEKNISSVNLNEHYNFKTEQTGQPRRKSLVDDYIEYEINSSGDGDSIIEDNIDEEI